MIELSDYEYLERGQQERINHNTDDCSGQSRSMVIRRTSNGSLICKCYRCGYFRKRSSSGLDALKRKKDADEGRHPEPDASGNYATPDDCIKDINDWPARARAWVWKYGITTLEVEQYGILYSPDLSRIILPVYSDDSSLAIYQTRKIFEEDTGPKYLTYKNRVDILNTGKHIISDKLVLVEDYLSAIKVGRFLPCISLLGTEIQPHHIDFIKQSNYTKFIIFFDDDNYIVKQKQLKCKQLLDIFGETVIIHSRGKDPKEYSNDELKEILDGQFLEK